MRELRIRTVAAALAGVSLIGLATPFIGQAQAQDASRRNFNIPARDMAGALETFGRQSGRDIMFDRGQVAGRRSNAVRGSLEPGDALRRLVSGSGLTVSAPNRATFVVGRGSGEAGAAGAAADSGSADEQAIVVTGTNIRGTRNRTAPLTILDRQAIDDSGFSTTQQLLDSIPQNFRGGSSGASEDGLITNAASAGLNVSRASGINLRGLGNTATLTLVNGHRMALSAFGSFVDISLIPLVAVERVEVLTDGSSAVYGADAVAGVVNFILRSDYDGAEANLRLGTTTQGGRTEATGSVVAGRSWEGGNITAVAQLQSRSSLRSDQRPFTREALQPTDILPSVDQTSVLIYGRQRLADGLTFRTEGLYSHKTSDQALGRSDFWKDRTLSSTSSYSLNGELNYAFDDNWSVSGSGLYSLEESSYRLFFPVRPPFYPGYVEGEVAARTRYRYSSGSIAIDGRLFDLPSGPARVAFGGAYREERFRNRVLFNGLDETVGRTVKAVFAETYLPLVGVDNRIGPIRTLDFSLSIRLDDYSDFGTTTNPRVGIYFSPAAGLGLRGTYSTSFRAPTGNELIVAGRPSPVALLPIFAAPEGGIASVFVTQGTAPNIRPERARNFTAGITYQPAFLPDLSFSATWYDIRFKDRIISAPFDPNALLRPDIFGSLITSLPDAAAALDFVASQIAAGNAVDDPFGVGLDSGRYIFDVRQQNAALVRQSGFDIAARYGFRLGGGRAVASLDASIITRIDTRFTETSAASDLVDTYGNPLRLRIRAGLAWERMGLRLAAFLNHSGDYTDTSSLANPPVEAWNTIDFTLRYAPTDWEGFSFSIDAMNALDADPPFVTGIGLSGVRYDVANANPLGRIVALSLRKAW